MASSENSVVSEQDVTNLAPNMNTLEGKKINEQSKTPAKKQRTTRKKTTTTTNKQQKTTVVPSSKNTNKPLMVSEILALANKESSHAGALKILNDNDSTILRYVLQAAYDKNVISLLPDGEPPFTPEHDHKLVDLSYYQKQFFMFFKHGPGEKMSVLEREQMFIRMLETLKEDESRVLVAAKDQRMQLLYKKLTPQLIKKFFDGKVNIQIDSKETRQNRQETAKNG